ncbi:uncharacterized protein LOC117073254 [Trachypithecus francoisi]|uniref:uncharacterized protein LOC117073254 n=1 Tax=Trachypithecus francoisi TaxID=54180 RepID=UPI00141BED83|nr:uncharacterized protein LOC117073254 [Trachypithecus francoisi]
MGLGRSFSSPRTTSRRIPSFEVGPTWIRRGLPSLQHPCPPSPTQGPLGPETPALGTPCWACAATRAPLLSSGVTAVAVRTLPGSALGDFPPWDPGLGSSQGLTPRTHGLYVPAEPSMRPTSFPYSFIRPVNTENAQILRGPGFREELNGRGARGARGARARSRRKSRESLWGLQGRGNAGAAGSGFAFPALGWGAPEACRRPRTQGSKSRRSLKTGFPLFPSFEKRWSW